MIKVIDKIKPVVNKWISKLKELIGKLKERISKLKESKALQDTAAKAAGLFKTIKSKPHLYILTILIIMVLLIIMARGCGKFYQTIKEKKVEAPVGGPVEPAQRIIPVKVFKAKRSAFKDTLPVLGSIKGFREVDLKFEVSGVLESFNFEEGEKVEEGDIIASLNQRDALLKLEYAKLEMDKNEKLHRAGAIIEAELEKSRLEYESSKSDFEKTNIYAPRDGYLGRKHAEEGEYLSSTSNDKVATFVDIGSVYAEFGIIEKDMPKISLGQRTEVFVDAYPDQSYEGIIDQITPVVEGKSRTQSLRVKLENTEDRLKPGMFARGIIATYEKENALLVPTNAVNKKDPGFFAYVIHPLEVQEPAEGEEAEEGEFGTVEIREVKVKYMAPDYTEISGGLEEEELVAVEVREEFKDKSKIEIKEVQESPF